MPYCPPNPPPDVSFTALYEQLNRLHFLVHSLFTWAARIECSLGLTSVELAVFWRVNDRAFVTRQRIPLVDFNETELAHRCALIRQAYQQSL